MKLFQQLWIAGVRRVFWIVGRGSKQKVYEIISNEKKVSAVMVAVKPPVDEMVLKEIQDRRR